VNFLEQWIDLLNPLGINSTLFSIAWWLGMAVAATILIWLVCQISPLSERSLSPTVYIPLVGSIALAYLIWAPYAGLCVMLACVLCVIAMALAKTIEMLRGPEIIVLEIAR
jgi:hypothetical protein